ncbi:MAG: hypothetical protein K8S98_15760 [Planctomycetes bacterium]|nr:hypothetical protein [Planctomycetota bacterium]
MKHTSLALIVLATASCSSPAVDTARPRTQSSLARTVEAATDVPSRPVKKAARRASKDELTQAYTYFDGAKRRTVYLSPELVAEFAPSDAGRDAVLAANDGYAERWVAEPTARVWRVGRRPDADAFARGLSNDTSHFSAVLHEGPSSELPMLALPGGVVASFRADWTRAEIDRWLATRGLAVERELVPGSNTFLVPTEPGLPALELANRLHDSGELISCTPNWWRRASVR